MNRDATSVTMKPNSNHSIGILFDMDGVLVDSAKPHLESWKQLAGEIGGSVTDAQFAATFGRQNRDIIPMLFGPTTDERMRRLSDRKEELYRDLVRQRPPIVGGAIELIDALFDRGVKLAIGSSGPRANIELVLHGMRVADRFHAVVSADDVTRGKPDPQVFAIACRRLNLHPSRCVVIEDAPVGIDAAKAAGTRAVAVLMHHPREAFPTADRIVERLHNIAVGDLISLAHGA